MKGIPGFKGFEVDLAGADKGKSVRAIYNSKAARAELLKLFGGTENLPSSIMKAKRAKLNAEFDLHAAKRGYVDSSQGGRAGVRDKISPSKSSLAAAMLLSGKGCGSGALSTFPQNVGRTVVLLYSDPGDVVFDPFAGHNSRMDLCVRAGRDYVGVDLNPEFMSFNRKRAKRLARLFPERKIRLHQADSRECPVTDGSGDFTITSPPYYDIEDYGDAAGQLGRLGSYEDFLFGLGRVLTENFRVLRPGAYCVWFVNDFRRKGKFCLYHVDTLRLAESVGFVVHDIMVVDFGPGIRDAFLNQVVESRILPKRHEYALVFRKPEVVSAKRNKKGARQKSGGER